MLCTKIGGDNLKLNSKVLSLACNFEEGSPFSSWSISYAAKHDDHTTLVDNQPYDAVIMTVKTVFQFTPSRWRLTSLIKIFKQSACCIICNVLFISCHEHGQCSLFGRFLICKHHRCSFRLHFVMLKR